MNQQITQEPLGWREEVILSHLLDNGGVSNKKQLGDQIYGEEGGPANKYGLCVRYFIRKLNAKLRPGWSVQCSFDHIVTLQKEGRHSGTSNRPYLLRHITAIPPSRCEAIVLRDLMDNDGITTPGRLIDHLYSGDPDGGPLTSNSCLTSIIIKLNPKLIPGWSIDRRYGRFITLNETMEI